MLPTLSLYTLDGLVRMCSHSYVDHEGSRTQEYGTTPEAAGVRALFITVDAPQLGRGEKGRRNKFTQQ